jgi:hypothetical protein
LGYGVKTNPLTYWALPEVFCDASVEFGRGQVGGLAVVLAEEAEDHRPSGRLSRQLHPTLDRLRAGHGDRRPGDVPRRQRDQPLGELDRRLAGQVLRDLHP